MKDLDFDELDKAVNSLMTKVPKDTASANAPGQQAPAATNNDLAGPASAKPAATTTNSATSPSARPETAPPVMPSPSPPPSPRQAPASRRSGRFMDVVPPSAATKPAARPVSREGAVVEPRSSTQPTAPTPRPNPAPTQPAVSEKTAPTSDWPDPLEMTGNAKSSDTPADQPTATTTPETQPDSQQKPPQTESTPLSSPFLPGAQVEKRPLGSASPPLLTPTTLSEDETKTSAVDDSNAQLPAMPSDTATTEPPEEFQDDLMKVESDTHMGVPKTDQSHPLQTPPPAKPAEEPQEPPQPKPTKPEEPAKIPTPAGRISIPQQYHEEPSTGEKQSGAIYDTDTYHQPLAHPAKKKSGWLWVLWIVIILLVGAGGGAALYFLGVM